MSQCYAPNAVPVPELGPCNAAESVSLCCTPGQICLTNGLCATGERQFYSGACTDKTYTASICPSFCNGTDKFVVECENSAIPNGKFCCDATGTGTCCNSVGSELDLSPSVSSAVAGTAISTQSSAANSGSSSVTSMESVSSQGFNLPAINPTITTSIHTVASTITSTLISVPPPTPTGPSSSASEKKQLAIGLGVGIPSAAIFILLTLAFALRKYRKRHNKKPNQSPLPRPNDSRTSPDNKSESNLHELHDAPAPVPELGPSSLPMSKISDPTIHEMDAGTPPNTRYQTGLENPFDPYPLPNASAFSLHNPAPSPSPASSAIVQMDGLGFGFGSSMPQSVSPPPYEIIEMIVPDQDENGADIGDQKVWRE